MKRPTVVIAVVAATVVFAPVAHAGENGYLQQVRATTSDLFSASDSQLLQLGYVACQAFGSGPHTPQTSLQADEAVAKFAYYKMGLRTGLAGSRFITGAADDNLC